MKHNTTRYESSNPLDDTDRGEDDHSLEDTDFIDDADPDDQTLPLIEDDGYIDRFTTELVDKIMDEFFPED